MAKGKRIISWVRQEKAQQDLISHKKSNIHHSFYFYHKGSKAREEIIIKTENDNVLVKFLDFSSMESVKQFAKDILETEQRWDWVNVIFF